MTRRCWQQWTPGQQMSVNWPGLYWWKVMVNPVPVSTTTLSFPIASEREWTTTSTITTFNSQRCKLFSFLYGISSEWRLRWRDLYVQISLYSRSDGYREFVFENTFSGRDNIIRNPLHNPTYLHIYSLSFMHKIILQRHTTIGYKWLVCNFNKSDKPFWLAS